MELRTLLYGYNKHQFRFYPNSDESAVVKMIFDEYISGKTLQQIADRLTAKQIVYYKDKTAWNKNMVRRILENRHYIGDEEYPAIVTADEFEKANKKRLSKGGERVTDTVQEKFFKYHTVCGKCGGRFTRRRTWSKTREKWCCTCGCKNTVYIDDKLFYSQIHSIISRVIAEPALLNVLPQENSLCALTPEVMRADKEIDRMTERKNIDFLPVKKAIFSNVSDKFDCCTLDRAKAFSGVLMQYYGEQTASDTINIKVLEDTVDKITVDENGIVSVEFLNGCRISKEDSNGNSSNTQTENYN